MYLIKKFFPFLCLVLSLCVFFYVFYKAQIYWDGENNRYYLLYYVVSLSFVAYSILLLILKNEAKLYITIIGLSIISTIYLFEGYLTYKEKIQNNNNKKIRNQIYETKTGKKYDNRSKFEVYIDEKKTDKNVVVGSYPRANLNYLSKNYKNFLPLSGVSNAKTIYCNENGYMSIDKTDRFGFNNPDDEWDKKKIDILIVGDSFAQGACVNRPNDIASVIRKFSKKNVINIGVGGNGPLLEYATLKEYLSPKVKNIFWLFSEWNDLENLEVEKLSPILQKYLNDTSFSQNLKLRQKEIDDITIEIIEIEKEKNINTSQNLKLYVIKNFIKLRKSRTIINNILPKTFQPSVVGPKKLQNDFKKIMILANELAKNNKSNLYFVYLPEYNRYFNSYDNNSFINVKKIIDEIGIPFINIHKEVFEKQENPLELFPFQMPGHYNIEGNRKIGEVLSKIQN